MLQSIFSAKWAALSIGTGPKPERISLHMQVQQQNSDLQFHRNSVYCSLNFYDYIYFQTVSSFSVRLHQVVYKWENYCELIGIRS